MPSRWYSQLRSGDGAEPLWSGVMAITLGLVATTELPDSALRTLLLDVDNEGVRYLHFDSRGDPRPRSDTERMITKAIGKARARQRTQTPLRDRGEVLERLAGIRAHLDDDPTRWRGRGGATDRAVLLGAIDIAERAGRLEFGASTRQLADSAGVGVHGAHAALARLRPWLRVVSPGAGARASTLRLDIGHHGHTSGHDGNPRSVPSTAEPEGSRHDRNNDLWMWGGGALGKSTERVHAELGAEPTSSAELALILGVTPRTVRHHLARLEQVDLAARVFDGWVSGPADPADVALALGVEGRGELQRLRHTARARSRREHKRSPREQQQRATELLAAVSLAAPRQERAVGSPGLIAGLISSVAPNTAAEVETTGEAAS